MRTIDEILGCLVAGLVALVFATGFTIAAFMTAFAVLVGVAELYKLVNA